MNCHLITILLMKHCKRCLHNTTSAKICKVYNPMLKSTVVLLLMAWWQLWCFVIAYTHIALLLFPWHDWLGYKPLAFQSTDNLRTFWKRSMNPGRCLKTFSSLVRTFNSGKIHIVLGLTQQLRLSVTCKDIWEMLADGILF